MSFERSGRGVRTEHYVVPDIIQVLNSLEVAIGTVDGQRALDAVAAAFGLRRVPVEAPAVWPRRVVVIEAPKGGA